MTESAQPGQDTAPRPSTPQGAESQEASGSYRPTARTVPSRSRERASYDRELVHAILDETYICHLGFVRDGAPVVLPTLYGRVGERLSSTARPARARCCWPGRVPVPTTRASPCA